MKFSIGDRVSLTKEALDVYYIKKRKSYTNMYEGKIGTVIGYTADGQKIAIQFDDIVFYKGSSHNNGCHGKGEIFYCWYIPEALVRLIDSLIDSPIDNPIDDSELLLLLC